MSGKNSIPKHVGKSRENVQNDQNRELTINNDKTCFLKEQKR